MDKLLDCRRCVRLSEYTRSLRQLYPDYHCKPVPAFGDTQSRLLIVGLAPGLHGANASGRPFTGDASGELLFQILFKFGFASQPISSSSKDGMILNNCRITNAVKCLPPQNKPNGAEIRQCNPYLRQELDLLPPQGIVLALGAIAHQAVIKAYKLKLVYYRVSHHAQHVLPGGLFLFDSYHCSRYNTQTRRLTADMFERLFADISQKLNHE